jgi:hypothetical protein
MRWPQATGLATGLPHFTNCSANFGLATLELLQSERQQHVA